MTHIKRVFVVGSIVAASLLAPAQEATLPSAMPAASAPTAVPRLVPYAGIAVDAEGKPLSGSITVTFLIFRDQERGEALWAETQMIGLDAQGHFTAELGATLAEGIPPQLFMRGEARWLEVQVAGREPKPRVLLASVPYALKAGDAATVGGLSADELVTREQLAAAVRTSVAPGAITGAPLPGPGTQAITPAIGIAGSGTPNYLAVWTDSSTLGNSLLYQSGNHFGIGTLTPTSPLQISTGYPSVTVNAANSLSTFKVYTPGLPIAAGIIDSGYRAGAVITNYTNDPHFLGTLSAQYGVWSRVGHATGAGAGTITNSYGVYIDNVATGGSAITNSYGLYQAASTAQNYFAGSLGIGTSNPTANLEVSGTSRFDGLASFAAGQTFPGTVSATAFGGGLVVTGPKIGLITSCSTGQVLAWTGKVWACATRSGTISEVIAGTGLTGGGKTGSVTLNLDTTQIPLLASRNTFSVGQTISSFDSSMLNASSNSFTSEANAVSAVMNGYGGVYGFQTAAVYAYNYDMSTAGYGVRAEQAGSGYGVWGAANGSTGEGVYGSSTSGLGVVGATSAAGGNWALYGYGNIGATGTKSSVVPVDSGTRQVALYAVESPGVWFEDYGSGRLVSGAAAIVLDSVFAQTVNTGVEYLVFITPQGDCEGLYVAAKSAGGFEVRELHHGTSNVAFDYRIVARRRGYESKRLEDVTASATGVAEKILRSPKGRAVAGDAPVR